MNQVEYFRSFEVPNKSQLLKAKIDESLIKNPNCYNKNTNVYLLRHFLNSGRRLQNIQI